MHLEKAKVLLDKLQNQVEQVQKGDDSASSLERDLLLMYTRQLYDAFLTESPKEEQAPKKEESLKEAAARPKKKSSFSFKSFDAGQEQEAKSLKPEEGERESQRKSEERAKKQEAERKQKEQERLEREKAERERQAKEEQHRQEEAKRKEEENKQEENSYSTEPVQKEPQEAENQDAQNTTFDENYDELFTFEEATDLSQKLSQSPINNLRKGLGINDKMLYGQELFGGNIGRLHDALDALDELENKEQARAYLEKEVLSDFDWAAKDKKRYARDFLKYINRRYL